MNTITPTSTADNESTPTNPEPAAETVTEQPSTTVEAIQDETRHELGYGLHIRNPEAFICSVIRHFFPGLNPTVVDLRDIVHEARVALFAQDLHLDGAIPQSTSGYWWRAAEAVGALLYEDYGIDSIFVRRQRPLSLYAAAPEDPELAEIYHQKQMNEPDPAAAVEMADFFEHYMGLAEGVILDHHDAQQGERDLVIFKLWINGLSLQEIAAHPTVTWLKNRRSADGALRRIIHRLWEFFGVDPDSHAMTVGDYTSNGSRTGSGASSQQTFVNWYADPENRARHQERARLRSRERRAAERVSREIKGLNQIED